jgi:hypothetical protein
MQVSWFFATTPVPQRPQVTRAPKRARTGSTTTWWTRAADRFVEWGERSARRHMTSSTYY